MDFTPTERQLAAAEAYASTSELAALPVPEDLGGAGLSVTELAALLTEAGRHADASVAPLLAAVYPLARWGDRALLPRHPSIAAVRAERGWARLKGSTISGVRPGVEHAEYLLIPAVSEGRVADDAVAVVAADAPGVLLTDDNSKKRVTVRMVNVEVTALFAGRDRVADLDRLGTLACCCLIDGAIQGALDLTAKHVAARRQFGRPLAEFQAVTQQIADIAIASRTLHVVTLSAAWQLETGAEGDDIEVAGYCAAEGARRVVMKCHHLHGGLGMDVTYPLHRFSDLVTDQVRELGGAEYRLERVACSST
jgi:3-oxo-4-pregnene-20-carboxyl-CoA dehydrogenase alpha subunit